jgi:hypothetical protein
VRNFSFLLHRNSGFGQAGLDMRGEATVPNNILFGIMTSYCIVRSRLQCFGGAY